MPSTDIQKDLLDATQIRAHLVTDLHYYNSMASGDVLFALGTCGHKLVIICVHVYRRGSHFRARDSSLRNRQGRLHLICVGLFCKF